MKIITFIITFLTVGTSPFPAQAKDVALFDCKHNALRARYSTLIQLLESGDRIDLCNGSTVTIESFAGEGNRTRVFRIRDEKQVVLRLPLSPDHQRHINDTIDGEKLLVQERVPHVRITSGKRGMWAMAEELQKDDYITFDQFCSGDISGFSTNETHLKEKLIEFGEKTYKFLRIGDLDGSNLVYSFSKDSWLAMDWTNTHLMWNEADFPENELHALDLAFDSHPIGVEAHADLAREIEQAVLKKRMEIHRRHLAVVNAKTCSRKSFLQKLFSYFNPS